MSWANLVMDLASIPDYSSKTKEGNKSTNSGKVIEVNEDNLSDIDRLLGI